MQKCVFSGKTGSGWSGSVNGLLAEVATCQLEYKYLAHVTGKRKYYDVVSKNRFFNDVLNANWVVDYFQAEKINNILYTANVTNLDGLFPTAFNLKTGRPANRSWFF